MTKFSVSIKYDDYVICSIPCIVTCILISTVFALLFILLLITWHDMTWHDMTTCLNCTVMGDSFWYVNIWKKNIDITYVSLNFIDTVLLKLVCQSSFLFLYFNDATHVYWNVIITTVFSIALYWHDYFSILI